MPNPSDNLKEYYNKHHSSGTAFDAQDIINGELLYTDATKDRTPEQINALDASIWGYHPEGNGGSNNDYKNWDKGTFKDLEDFQKTDAFYNVAFGLKAVWEVNKDDQTESIAKGVLKGDSYALAIMGKTDFDIQAIDMSIFFHHEDGLDGDMDEWKTGNMGQFEAFKNSAEFKALNDLSSTWAQIQEKGVTSALGEKLAKGDIDYAEATAGRSETQITAIEMSTYFHTPVKYGGLGGDQKAWESKGVTDFTSFKNSASLDFTNETYAINKDGNVLDEVVITANIGPDLETLKMQLTGEALGFDFGPIDGDHGSKTDKGCYSCLSKDGATSYGDLNNKDLRAATMAQLKKDIAADPALQVKVSLKLIDMIKNGNENEIMAAQGVMHDMGFIGSNDKLINPDGIVGDNTRFALNTLETTTSGALARNFQELVGDEYRLKATGIIARVEPNKAAELETKSDISSFQYAFNKHGAIVQVENPEQDKKLEDIKNEGSMLTDNQKNYINEQLKKNGITPREENTDPVVANNTSTGGPKVGG